MKKVSSEKVVWTSFIVDVVDIVTNVIVAIISGSVVILATALRGMADLLTTGFLLIGIRLSKRRADRGHKFGYGRELYFWAFLSSLAMLTITGGLSFYYGWKHYRQPEEITSLGLSFAVLGVGMLTNIYALSLDTRRLRQSNLEKNLWHGFFHSSLVEVKIAFVLDLMGAITAFLGIFALGTYKLLGDARLDGLGAIMIGSTVIVLAIYLIAEIKDLLIGRSALPEVEKDIKKAAIEIDGVDRITGLRTLYIGSDSLMVNMVVAMDSKLTTNTLEQIMDQVKLNVKRDVPSVKHILVEFETSID
jgi:cation diffusion facilitator family transporter